MPKAAHNGGRCSEASQELEFTENSIELKIKSKEKSFHTFLIHNLSLQVLLSNQTAVFNDQLETC